MKIKNRKELLSAVGTTARRFVVDIMEATLQAIDGYHLIKECLHVDGDHLLVGDHTWDLRKKRHLYVIGAGKACNSMAKAVEEKLGDRISTGLVIVKHIEPGDELERIELIEGGHPLPNREGLCASRRILQLVEQASPDDLFLSVISGGSSALMACPVSEVTPNDEIEITDRLIKSGARILEINAVRRHISATNGGRLAQKVEARGAEMINLIISDLVEEGPKIDAGKTEKFFGTPVGPDETTFEDARSALQKYDLWASTPRSIVDFLRAADPSMETPKMLGRGIHHFVLLRPADACEVAKKSTESLGIPGFILTTRLVGESREAGTFLACVAKEIYFNHRPLPHPCALIAGGETTTRIEGASGAGGPSQELALGFALEVANLPDCAIAAIDTDGTDGPTDVAGGIGDSTTVERARSKGFDIYRHVREHDSFTLLKALGDPIITGNTGTNVCDLNVICLL